jgi:hypothetical protein
MSDPIFSLDNSGKLIGAHFKVTQGDQNDVSFVNLRGPVRITVTGTPNPKSLFGAEEFTVEAIAPPVKRIAANPDLGIYQLSAASGGQGTIEILDVSFIIDGAGNTLDIRSAHANGSFGVRQGAEPVVRFTNKTSNDVTVIISGVILKTGGDFRVPVTDIGGREQLVVPKTKQGVNGVATAVVRDIAPVGDYAFTLIDGSRETGPCTGINVHPHT